MAPSPVNSLALTFTNATCLMWTNENHHSLDKHNESPLNLWWCAFLLRLSIYDRINFLILVTF